MQPGELGTPQSGGGHEQPSGVQAIVAHVAEEGAQLLGRPDPPFGWQALWRVNGGGDVAGNVAPAHSVLQGPMEDGMDILDGLGGHAMTVPEPALGEKCLIQGIEVDGGELLERDRAKRRKHAGADVRAVVREGRRPEIAQGRQPLTDEEALEGPLGRLDERASPQGGQRVVEGCLALPLGLEPALGLLLALAGDRVDADVDVPGPSGPALVGAPSHWPSIRSRGAVGTSSWRPTRKATSCPAFAAR